MERISEKEVQIGSLLVALMICSKLINTAIPKLYTGGIQAGMITMGSIWGLYIIYVFLFEKFQINIIAAGFMAYILIFFAISNVVYSDHIRLLTLHFIEYGVAGFLIAGTKFDVEKTTRYTAYLLLILVYPIFLLLQDNSMLQNDSMGMGISYALVSPTLATIAHFLYYRKKKDYFIYIAYAFSAYLSFQIVARGIRGSILCVLVFAFFAVLNHEKFRGQFNLRRGIVLIIVFICLLNIDYLVTFISNALSTVGIHIQFIDKTIALGNNTGDISNGRINIYSIAIKDFLESPIWGNCIGYFPEIHGINYPHNMILQVLGEGGILLGIPIIVLLAKIVFDLIFGRIGDRDLRIIIILLASCTIPAAFVSDEIWNYQLLWLLFGIFIKKVVPLGKKNPISISYESEGNLS